MKHLAVDDEKLKQCKCEGRPIAMCSRFPVSAVRLRTCWQAPGDCCSGILTQYVIKVIRINSRALASRKCDICFLQVECCYMCTCFKWLQTAAGSHAFCSLNHHQCHLCWVQFVRSKFLVSCLACVEFCASVVPSGSSMCKCFKICRAMGCGGFVHIFAYGWSQCATA